MKRATVDIDSTRSLGIEATEKREGARLLSFENPNVSANDSLAAERDAAPNPEIPGSGRNSALRPRMHETWAGEVWRRNRRFLHEIYHWTLCEHESRPDVKHLAESLAALQGPASNAANAETDTEAPIFLLSTGWRTGSTLLQRILVTDPRVFIWGEPLGEMTLVSRITELLNDYLSPRNLASWQTQPSMDNLSASSLATSWIATLSPEAGDFRVALRSLFDRWLAGPAQRRGCARWGFKEVRLGAAEASLLYWLYPNAKFVILSRHPYECYMSLSDANFHPLYHRYPSERVDSAAGFASHWNQLALSWLELAEEFPFFHVKYEDLISGNFDFRKLESWLGIEITEEVAMSVIIGHSSIRSRLSWYERSIIAHEAAPGMQALGYSR
jgi:hypothetical protein